MRTLAEEISALEQGLPPSADDGFIGGRLDPREAALVLLPVPWHATVSFRDGTANAPARIRSESHQLDVESFHYDRAYRAGIAMLDAIPEIAELNVHARDRALRVIEALETNTSCPEELSAVNAASERVNALVREQAELWLEAGKAVGLVGGDHSSPLGLIKALNDREQQDFGILHIDAHHDLREAYEDFTYSHASIFYNVMQQCPRVSHLAQLGIRDYSREESQRLQSFGERASCYYDADFQRLKAEGATLAAIYDRLLAPLPQNVYISLDIDGLEPANCPNTGTPVPGGLTFSEMEYLLYHIVRSGRRIIGFDLCEVGISDEGWDENVGARLLYQLSGALLASQDLVALR